MAGVRTGASLIKLHLEGNPVAHRYEIVKRGAFYSLAKTKKYAAWRADLGFQVLSIKNRLRLTCFAKGTPLGIAFTFRFTRPKSVKRKYPTVPPDLNNIIKPVEDALKGILIYDDRDIVHYGDTWQLYCEPGEPPGISVQLWEVE